MAKEKKEMPAKYMFLIAVVAYVGRYFLGPSAIGNTLATMGFFALAFSIIAFYRERKARKIGGPTKTAS